MRTLTTALLFAGSLVAIGCGGGGGGPTEPFGLTVDTVTIQSTISDNLDAAPEVDADGTPVTVVAGAFTATLDTTTVKTHAIHGKDNVPNTKTLTVQVQ